LIIKEQKLGLSGWLLFFVLLLSGNGVSADSDSLESRLKEFNAPEKATAQPAKDTTSAKIVQKKSSSKAKKTKKYAKRKRYKRACYQSSVKTLLDRAESLQPAIRNASHRYGVSEALIISIITAESCFSRTARSPKNAQGLMQLIPVMSVYRRIQDSKGVKPIVRQARYVAPVRSSGYINKGNFIKPDFKWKRKPDKGRVNNLYKVSSRSPRSVCRDVSSVKLKKNSWLVKNKNGMKRYYSSRKPKSLSSIAKDTGVNLSLLLRMNRNASKYMVKPGGKILVWQCASR